MHYIRQMPPHPRSQATPQDLSSFRSQVLDLKPQLPALLESFLGREPLLPGSFYTLRRRCGKPTCHCARGELHASIVLSYRGEGRPQNITLPPEQLREVRKLTEDYRAFRQPLADPPGPARPPGAEPPHVADDAAALARRHARRHAPTGRLGPRIAAGRPPAGV